jgi:hypothetical protein
LQKQRKNLKRLLLHRNFGSALEKLASGKVDGKLSKPETMRLCFVNHRVSAT